MKWANKQTESDKQNKLIRPDGWLDGWRQTGQSSQRDGSTVTLGHQGGSKAAQHIFRGVNVHLDSFTSDTNAPPPPLQCQQLTRFTTDSIRKDEDDLFQRLRQRLEEKTAEVIFDESTKGPILHRKNLWDKDGAVVEGVDEGGESDRGIHVKHTNRLIMNPYKSVDFCKHSTSAKHSCVSKDCKSKDDLNVFEMASIS